MWQRTANCCVKNFKSHKQASHVEVSRLVHVCSCRTSKKVQGQSLSVLCVLLMSVWDLSALLSHCPKTCRLGHLAVLICSSVRMWAWLVICFNVKSCNKLAIYPGCTLPLTNVSYDQLQPLTILQRINCYRMDGPYLARYFEIHKITRKFKKAHFVSFHVTSFIR